MAQLTPLPLEQARELLLRYEVELLRITPLTAGSVNSNFLLEGRDGREYFARIYEEQGPTGAAFELQLNDALASAGIPVARPLRPSGAAPYLLTAGKPFAVYERVHGEVLCQRRVTPQIAGALGECLAAVHLAPLAELVVPEGRFGFLEIEQRLCRVERSNRADLLPAVGELRALAARLLAERKPELPCGLIHGDLFRDNVLVRAVEPSATIAALLDFESACRGPYVYDLMVTVLAWCFGDDLEPDLARAMIAGYQAVRPLSPEEEAEFVTEGSVACLRFAVTRLTDFSLRVEAGTLPARDYRRFLARLAALSEGALARALIPLDRTGARS